MTADVEIAISRVAGVSAVPTILKVITQITGLRLSLVAHVTDQTWTCCAVNDQLAFGLEVGGELEVATTLCKEVCQHRAPIVMSHASVDPAYKDHPTPRLYKFESHISVPIFLRGGEYFGNVCALDADPVDLDNEKTRSLFKLFADLIGLQLDAEAQQQKVATALLDALATSELREQFIAVLGHDVRTPLNAIAMGTELLKSEVREPSHVKIVDRIGRSVERISRLVDDVVDFARGRLGGGIPLNAAPISNVTALFRQVVDELQSSHPRRSIQLRTEGRMSVQGDAGRLTQVLQNLLANALVHSPPEERVEVVVKGDEDGLSFSVINGGPAIPEALVARMFEPFKRGAHGGSQGLGLGLYIASQIVRSHGGTIQVTSDDAGTAFTCRLPRPRAA